MTEDRGQTSEVGSGDSEAGILKPGSESIVHRVKTDARGQKTENRS